MGEARNLAESHPDLVLKLKARYAGWEKAMRPPAWPPRAGNSVVVDGVEIKVNI